MESLVENTIIAEIRVLSAAANLPKGFAENVKFVKTARNKGEIINTWGSQEKPLAKYFNYGTTKHWIEPVNASVLAWQAKPGKHASAIYFQGEAKKGDTLFSKGHYVSGVPRTEVMERGFNLGIKLLTQQAKKIVENEIQHVEYRG